jgi:hypothetical protein
MPFYILFLLAFISCGPSSQQPVIEPSQSAAEPQGGLCVGKGGALMGEGRGESRVEVRKEAIRDISQQITNIVKINTSDIYINSSSIDTSYSLDSSHFEEISKMTGEFLAAGRLEQLNDSVFYICRSEAAKPYLDSLEINFKTKLKVFAAMPRPDEKACASAREIYAKKFGWQDIVEGLKQQNPLKKEYEEVYAKIEKECCQQNARLYWSSEKNPYSEMAFSVLSKFAKMEKSQCKGDGILLLYKDREPECIRAGVYKCSYKPSLLITSCEGAEYRLLASPEIGNYHQKKDIALGGLQDKLKEAAFWKEWKQEMEQEIKKRSPKCE